MDFGCQVFPQRVFAPQERVLAKRRRQLKAFRYRYLHARKYPAALTYSGMPSRLFTRKTAGLRR